MVWLRSKTNQLHALRDGRGPHRPMLALFSQPQWFSDLDGGAFKDDREVSVVDPKDVDESICDPKTGKPKKSYKPKLYADVKALEKAQKSVNKNLARRQVLAVDLAKLDAAEPQLKQAAADPVSAAGQRAKRALGKAEAARESIFDEMQKIEDQLKMAGVDLKEIAAIEAIDQAAASVDQVAQQTV